MQGWTHVGRFFGLPVYLEFPNNDGFSAVMRWTHWTWPIDFLVWMHCFLNWMHGTQHEFCFTHVREI